MLTQSNLLFPSYKSFADDHLYFPAGAIIPAPPTVYFKKNANNNNTKGITGRNTRYAFLYAEIIYLPKAAFMGAIST